MNRISGSGDADFRHVITSRNAIRSLAVGLFFLGSFTLPMSALRFAGITLSDLLFLGAVATAILCANVNTLKPLPAVQLSVWLFTLGIVLSTFQSTHMGEAFAVGARVLFLWTLWIWSARVLLVTLRHLDTAVLMFCVGAGISVVAAIAQVSLGTEISGVAVNHGRAPGLQLHPNGQGGLLAAALPLAFAFAIHGRMRVIYGALSMLYVVGLIMAGTVSGMLAAAIGTGIVLIRRGISIGSMMSVAPFLGISVWLSLNIGDWFPNSPSPINRFLDTTGQGQGEGTFASRLESMRYALTVLESNPIMGYGLDSDSVVEYRNGIETHNFFLYTWVQGGALSLLAVLLIVSASFMALRRCKGNSARTVKDGAMASMFALILFSMSGPVLFERWFWLPFALSFALLTVLGHDRSTEAPNRK